MNPAQPARALLSVRHLKVHLQTRGGLPWRRQRIAVIDDLHLDVRAGEIIGIVGERGCGKSVLVRAIAGILPSSGSIRCGGTELGGGSNIKALRHSVQLLEAPYLADAKPRRRVQELVVDALRERQPATDRAQLEARSLALLASVGIAEKEASGRLKSFAAEARARIALARALAMQAQVLICDASDAGLEASQRLDFLTLLAELAQENHLALILLARDPAALHDTCSRLSTMVVGKVTEHAPMQALLNAPRHPYSRALLAAPVDTSAPTSIPTQGRSGPEHPPLGCVFHPRCTMAESICVRSVPHLRRVGPEHYAACHFVAENSI